MRNFTATAKEGLPGQPCFTAIERDGAPTIALIVDDLDTARSVAAMLNEHVRRAAPMGALKPAPKHTAVELRQARLRRIERVFEMRERGMTFVEIGKEFGVTASAVRPDYYRAARRRASAKARGVAFDPSRLIEDEGWALRRLNPYCAMSQEYTVTLEDAANMTDRELRAIPNLGEQTLRAIRALTANMGGV